MDECCTDNVLLLLFVGLMAPCYNFFFLTDSYIGILLQTRSMAQMSQMLRDKIRMKYEHDTFDRKVLDAQLFARIENSPAMRRLAKAS